MFVITQYYGAGAVDLLVTQGYSIGAAVGGPPPSMLEPVAVVVMDAGSRSVAVVDGGSRSVGVVDAGSRSVAVVDSGERSVVVVAH